MKITTEMRWIRRYTHFEEETSLFFWRGLDFWGVDERRKARFPFDFGLFFQLNYTLPSTQIFCFVFLCGCAENLPGMTQYCTIPEGIVASTQHQFR